MIHVLLGKLLAGNPSYDTDSASTILTSENVLVSDVRDGGSSISTTSAEDGDVASDDLQVLTKSSRFSFLESFLSILRQSFWLIPATDCHAILPSRHLQLLVFLFFCSSVVSSFLSASCTVWNIV